MPAVAHPRACAYNSIAVRGAAAADSFTLAPVLMDGALEHIAQARGYMEDGEFSEKSRLLHAAMQLVADLRGGLDLRAEDAYAAHLDDVYDYVSRQLAAASLQNQLATLDEVSHLLREIRSAWLTYV